MGIEVAPELERAVLATTDAFAIQIRQVPDFRAPADALEAARKGLTTVGGSRARVTVSPVVLAPGGPMVVLTGAPRQVEVGERVADQLTEALANEGVTDATITGLPGNGLAELDRCSNAAILRLFPEPRGEQGLIVPDWVDLAAEWLLGDLGRDEPVRLRLLGIEFTTKVAEAAGVLHQTSQSRAWCDAVTGSFTSRIRTASITFGRAPHIALGAGGPTVDSAGLMARFELLQDVAREYAAGVAYACIDLEQTFEGLSLGLASGWQHEGGAPPHVITGELCDIAIPDAYPYQLLGPGHLARLSPDDHDPDDPPFGEPVGNGRFEVLCGEPNDWLPAYDVRDEVQAEGWELLGPCLLTADEAHELVLQRHPERTGDEADSEPTPAEAPVTIAGLPELAAITIDGIPRGRRGTHLSILQLASWLAQQPHTDEPRDVSSVIATYVRLFAQGLDDERRQQLKPQASRLIGTVDARTTDDLLGPTDADRAWLACDWLVRRQGEEWLRAAGLTESADRISRLEPVTDHLELVRAVDILGAAATIASRRIDITLNIASSDPDEKVMIDQIAWDTWERASEASAWVASSEAASQGIPSDLFYVTDLRVIECSRDPRLRDELEAQHRTLGDNAWTAALSGVAELAWTAAWDTAEELVSTVSSFSLRTAMQRSALAACEEEEIDDEQAEPLIATCEEAARLRLGELALLGDVEHDPWTEALRAASASENGHLWIRTLEMARHAVGASSFDEAMSDAGRAATAALQRAADIVGRTVAVAVAREAASAAGRGLALRAAAVARAHGADEDGAARAAEEALAPCVTTLADEGFDLLIQMIER